MPKQVKHKYLDMNRLSPERRAQVISALVEGNSIRSTCRMTGAAKGTVLKRLADVGEACAKFHAENVVDVPSSRVQCDEVWSFCYAKAKNVPRGRASLVTATCGPGRPSTPTPSSATS